jgi:CBS domain containing-hemolysin-like protein
MTLTTADIAALMVVVLAQPASALLAITDTVLTQVTRARVEALAEEEPANRSVRTLGRLLERRDEALHPVLLLELGCDVVAAASFGVVLYRAGGGVAFVVGLLLFVPAMFLLAVSLPRAWALHNLNRAIGIAGPIGMAVRRLLPVRLVALATLAGARRLFPARTDRSLAELGDQSFVAVAGSPTESDRIDLEGQELLASVIDFGATVVREIMVPRPDMVALAATLDLAEAVAVVEAEGYSRYPVIGSSIDDVVGVVYAKDIARAAMSGRQVGRLAELARPARFVPELKPVATLLRELQQEKQHLAVVVDEYGGTAGLVTLEDILEELVGDIEDEFDDGRPAVEHLADGSVRVEARLPLDEVNDDLGLALPEGDWDTVGGLLIDHFGRIPEVGDVARFGEHELLVTAMRGRRIVTVLVRAASGAETARGEPTPGVVDEPAPGERVPDADGAAAATPSPERSEGEQA